MRALSLSIVGFLAALLAMPGAALAQSPAPATIERSPLAGQADPDSIPRRGILYEAKSGASTLYLFGTLHVGKPEFYPLDARTNRAFAASSTLYLELNLSDSTLAQTATELAAYPPGSSLDRALPPALMAKVDAALKRYQIPREAAVRMKPWMLGQTFLLFEAARNGYNPAFATEIHLIGLAAAQAKEVRGLETLADQFAIFDRMPESGQQRFLEDIVDALDDPKLKANLDGLVNAWASADARALEEELEKERGDGSAFARDV
ncbi:MAG TPA: TraB/GumN family protein, partial [Sphingomicrobium sp.]